jgi:hypothetical protein
VRLWYDRLWIGINNPRQVINLTELATSNDTFKYGRMLNAHVSSLLHVLQVTGDPALLEEVDRLTELMRAQLQDRSILTYNGTSYQSDGYLNWQYFYDAGYKGTDVHEMDEMLAHSFVAAFAYAFHVNRDLDPRYAERADFWTNYLKNHFEAKWRARKNKPTGNFLEKDLAHPYTQWIRYHYYMHKLTGEQAYLTEATRRAQVFKGHMINVNGGSSVVWDHRMTEVNGASSWGCQPFYYGRQTVMAAIDLTLQKFSTFDDALVTKMAGTVRDQIIDNGSTDFAPDICGGTSLGGLKASGFSRETQTRWSDTAGYQETGAWDATGTIMNVSNQVHNNIEGDPANPRYILNVSGIVFSLLYN